MKRARPVRRNQYVSTYIGTSQILGTSDFSPTRHEETENKKKNEWGERIKSLEKIISNA